MQIRPSTSDAPPRLQRLLLKIQPYDFEMKYIAGKVVALVNALSRVKPREKMELKGLDFTAWINPMHATNTYVNYIYWTEEGCNNAVIDPTVCFQGCPSPAKRWTQPSRYGALRHGLSIYDGCIAYLGRLLFPPSLWEKLWNQCIGVIQGCLRCILG